MNFLQSPPDLIVKDLVHPLNEENLDTPNNHHAATKYFLGQAFSLLHMHHLQQKMQAKPQTLPPLKQMVYKGHYIPKDAKKIMKKTLVS